MAKGFPISSKALEKLQQEKANGKDWQEIAGAIGISYSLLNFLRNGERKVGFVTAVKLASYLEMPAEEVVQVS